MLTYIMFAFAIPLFTAILTMFIKQSKIVKWMNLMSSGGTSFSLFIIIYNIISEGPFQLGFIYIDALSSVFLLVVAVLSFTAVLFSLSYMDKELADGHISLNMLPRYYALFQMFVFTMIAVLVVENLGLMWVAVEATTLASALLVAFYFNRTALEAAWKYVMVCTVGICMALLGTILLYNAQVQVIGTLDALSWVKLNSAASYLNPNIVKLAFVFIFIGYGTKIGLAPMHTWLPDAYSQAPSPVSGLLAALSSCALYVLLRNLTIVQITLGTDFPQILFISFGLFSILLAVPFLLVQHDIKRLLAYSSVEHMGLITFGLGIGTPLAVYGALLHILNHALSKSVLFYIAGVVIQQYKTKHVLRIRGLVSLMPAVGSMFIIALLGITGTPPLSVFFSKFLIITAAFYHGHMVLGAVVLILMAGVFAGMMYYALKMSYGRTVKEYKKTQIEHTAMLAMSLSVLGITLIGVYMPSWLDFILSEAAAIVVGG